MRTSFIMALVIFVLSSCSEKITKPVTQTPEVKPPSKPMIKEILNEPEKFVWNPENFADIKIIRYQIPGFDKLNLQQKKLVYYLTQAGLAGRDISYDQNYRHNLKIRRALENIIMNYNGDKNTEEWKNLMTYTKRIWFSSGIHHHYATDKFKPEFSKDFFKQCMDETATKLSDEMLKVIFDPTIDSKKINLDPAKGLVKGSAVNFYDPDITEKEVDEFYANLMKDKDPEKPLSYGLNSKVVRGPDGKLMEKVYHLNGMYGAAIKEIIKWLELAVEVAENKPQAEALSLLIDYYKTGSLQTWDAYNVAWVKATEGDIDYINSFIEVYNDPKGYKGAYESIVEINDFDASARMAVVSENAQYFENNSPTLPAHKKKNVVGVSYKVVTVAGEAGDASPSTPIGVNLPNANWIRAAHGSKSVSLGNIVYAYSQAGGPGMLKEFAHDDEEIARATKYGKLGDKMHTALHEVVGHASGQIEPGVGTPKETLKNYASPLEEARADLVALYYIMDPKLIELGLMESLEVGKAEYDSYMKNGYMTQLTRIIPGNIIEQAHMRDRSMVAHWVFEKGEKNGAIEKVTRNGNTYLNILDYDKMRVLFGELLKEVQRIKSQGDYEAGRDLIENYGVQVDPVIHKEILDRAAKLNIPPYGGFINPVIVPTKASDGEITGFKIEYPDSFTEQMLYYAKNYSFLPDDN